MKLKLYFYLLFIIYPILIVCFQITELKNNILNNYRRDIIPLINVSKINVSIGIALRALNKVNHINGQIEINLWLRYKWKDKYLQWNDNIKSLNFFTDPSLSDSIWVPDIYLYNTGENPMINMAYTSATVNNNGDVSLSRPGIIIAKCKFDLKDFPYDEQICYLKFGSWSYNANQIFLQSFTPSIDIDNYQKNEEWDLISYNTTINTKKYACCEELYQDITFSITIRRKPHYYNLNIILPAFTTASLMILTFLIPRNSGERISFATTVMLSIVVFLLILSDNLPKTASSPLISLMFIGLLLFCLVGLFATICIGTLSEFPQICNKNKISNENLENSISESQSKIDNKTNNYIYKIEFYYSAIYIIIFISFIIIIINQLAY